MKKLTILLLVATLLLSVMLISCDTLGGTGEETTEAAKPESPIEGCTGVQFALSEDGKYYFLRSVREVTQPDIVIPSTYEGLPVVSISNYAFRNCSTLKSIVIPDSVQQIGIESFANCTALESVTMEGIISIGIDAFDGCTSLKNVSVSDTIESISLSSFSDCANIVYTESEGGKYLGNEANPYAALMELVSTDITSFKVNAATKAIADAVFYDCTHLSSVEIPASVTSIGGSAFSGCENLTSVTFEEGSQLKWIWDYAFEDCEYLCNMTIPSGTLYIGEKAFSGCKNLGSLFIPASVETVGYYAFTNTMRTGYDAIYYVKIYCEAESCPAGWHSQWNGDYDNDCEVVWGSTGN